MRRLPQVVSLTLTSVAVIGASAPSPMAAYAADEDNLGAKRQGAADTALQLRTSDGSRKASFVRRLTALLKAHNYG